MQRRQRGRFAIPRLGGIADAAGHAIRSRDLEELIDEAADLCIIRRTLEQRHGLSLNHGYGGGNCLDLEGLGQLGEGVDVRGGQDEASAVALHHALRGIKDAGRLNGVGGPKNEQHWNLA